MPYTIFNTDGSVLLLLADGQLDQSTTSLTLIGKNYPIYGQELNNNFIKLLANSASTAGRPPRSPIKGQLWYDTTNKRLKLYDNGFKTIGAVNIATTQPVGLQTGDLWFDSTNNQLKLYSNGQIFLVGPTYPSNAGSTGWVIPQSVVTDNIGAPHDILFLKSYGTTIGVAYDNELDGIPFTMSGDDVNAYMPNASTSTVVSGITILNNLSVNGKITNNYLSFAVDLDVISPDPVGGVLNNALGYGGSYGTATIAIQNPEICNLLNKMFPPNATTASSTATLMSGVFLGTQARILCKYSRIGTTNTSGYQVRVFKTIGNHYTATWEPFYFTEAIVGGSGSPVGINYIE